MQNEKQKQTKITVQWHNQEQAVKIRPLDDDYACMISIYTPGDWLPDFGKYTPPWRWFWQDCFYDVDFFTESSIYKPITMRQAESLFAFIAKIRERRITEVHVHCDAGISRSAAIAKFIAEKYDAYFPETYTVYNKRVYRSLLKVEDFVDNDANVSYEEWWAKA